MIEQAPDLVNPQLRRRLRRHDHDPATVQGIPHPHSGLKSPPMVQIGPLRIDPPLWRAPMAGVTDRDFRLLIRRIGGVGVVSMEFVSSRAIVQGNKRTREMMTFSPEERP